MIQYITVDVSGLLLICLYFGIMFSLGTFRTALTGAKDVEDCLKKPCGASMIDH
ncbi:hypothetical protein M430DRAFT_168195 [Amorphotheca resinae ATCC 22711]|jgi:hypothetical protein|uniref:Uncharacterized protein n=1 Tax=Amorphotheca resinae ATCC 22711 TaxID=857342 RepID=A0A2T3AU64_AMORE|nr:hypothetical protein M430DRAFT_168195 [Amorphotheca resinae ATCC 22711]PSS12219.1 hypothetical protein M430DRAFT_168195 [Amorphotheca resinae ATCC 22711]